MADHVRQNKIMDQYQATLLLSNKPVSMGIGGELFSKFSEQFTSVRDKHKMEL